MRSTGAKKNPQPAFSLKVLLRARIIIDHQSHRALPNLRQRVSFLFLEANSSRLRVGLEAERFEAEPKQNAVDESCGLSYERILAASLGWTQLKARQKDINSNWRDCGSLAVWFSLVAVFDQTHESSRIVIHFLCGSSLRCSFQLGMTKDRAANLIRSEMRQPRMSTRDGEREQHQHTDQAQG
jgi:hypothetical protein